MVKLVLDKVGKFKKNRVLTTNIDFSPYKFGLSQSLIN